MTEKWFSPCGEASAGLRPQHDRIAVSQTVERHRSETTLRKTFKDTLRPALTQERARDAVVWRGDLYNAAWERRITAYRHAGVSVSRSQQEAERKVMRAAFLEDEAIHAHSAPGA